MTSLVSRCLAEHWWCSLLPSSDSGGLGQVEDLLGVHYKCTLLRKCCFPRKVCYKMLSPKVNAVQVYVCASVCVCVCVCVHVYVSMCMYAFSCTAEMKCDTKWKPCSNRCWLKVDRFGRRLDPWQHWSTGSSVQPNSPAWWTSTTPKRSAHNSGCSKIQNHQGEGEE